MCFQRFDIGKFFVTFRMITWDVSFFVSIPEVKFKIDGTLEGLSTLWMAALEVSSSRVKTYPVPFQIVALIRLVFTFRTSKWLVNPVNFLVCDQSHRCFGGVLTAREVAFERTLVAVFALDVNFES